MLLLSGICSEHQDLAAHVCSWLLLPSMPNISSWTYTALESWTHKALKYQACHPTIPHPAYGTHVMPMYQCLQKHKVPHQKQVALTKQSLNSTLISETLPHCKWSAIPFHDDNPTINPPSPHPSSKHSQARTSKTHSIQRPLLPPQPANLSGTWPPLLKLG